MIEIQEEVTENYIYELFEYKTEWLKMCYAIISGDVDQQQYWMFTELARTYAKTHYELKYNLLKESEEILIWSVYEFLDEECNRAIEAYKETPLSSSTKSKLEEWGAITEYIRRRCIAILAIEDAF